MKKFLKSLLLLMCFALPFVSCSDDDDELDQDVTVETVTGTWNVIWAEQGGETLDVPSGYVWAKFNSDYTYRVKMFDESYSGKYEIKGNKIIGVTRDPITETFVFTELSGNKASIDYSNSEGEKMKFKAVKE